MNFKNLCMYYFVCMYVKIFVCTILLCMYYFKKTNNLIQVIF